LTREVIFTSDADADLAELYDYIATQGSPARALAYVQRITAFCRGLVTFPKRGSRRDDLRPGLRTIGFGRRDSIAFLVSPDAVVIVRILHGGRDMDAVFEDWP
jgi:toxin ParE1/3/4